MNMQKRITAQGPKDRKSYTVTLPIEWVKKEKIDKNRSVELNVVGNTVTISSQVEEQERVIVNGEDYRGSLIKVMQGLYRAGVNEIKVNFESNSTLEECQSITEKYLIGYEVIEQKKDYLVIKDITRESEEDFKIIFRRIFLILLEITGNEDQAQMNSLDKTLKKLTNYCQRILIKKGHIEFRKIPFYYLILDRIEKISDEYRWISRLKMTKKYDALHDELCGLLRIAYELFYKFEPIKYNKFSTRTYDIRNSLKAGENAEMVVIHLHNIARALNSLGGDIFVLKYDSKEN
jgi:phosphate uptake regulator